MVSFFIRTVHLLCEHFMWSSFWPIKDELLYQCRYVTEAPSISSTQNYYLRFLPIVLIWYITCATYSSMVLNRWPVDQIQTAEHKKIKKNKGDKFNELCRISCIICTVWFSTWINDWHGFCTVRLNKRHMQIQKKREDRLPK